MTDNFLFATLGSKSNLAEITLKIIWTDIRACLLFAIRR